MRIAKRVAVLLAAISILLAVNSNFIYVFADEVTEELAEPIPDISDDEIIEETQAENDEDEVFEPEKVSELDFREDAESAESPKLIIRWNSVNDTANLINYELSIYKDDVSILDITIDLNSQNNLDDENWDYQYEFTDIKEDGTYYCSIRACYSTEDAEGNLTSIYSEYTQSDSIEITLPTLLTLKINTNDWTSNTTPEITWDGLVVDNHENIIVQYQINNGEWMDSEWIGISGTGKFDSEAFSKDGEYQIRVRGKVELIDEQTGEVSVIYGEESEPVTYKRDAAAPKVTITSPKSMKKYEDNIKIRGSIFDSNSGIDGWILEYESNDNPGVWETFAFGDNEVHSNMVLTNWDISSLPIGFYTIRITVTDNDSNKSKSSDSVVFQIINNDGPESPQNINATLLSGTSINAQIFWDDKLNSKDTTYCVYRSSSLEKESAVLVAQDLQDTFFKDKDILYGHDYYYWVSAKSNGMESEVSEEFAHVKLDKKLGLQDYWSFIDFETITGKGYINIANGNLVYNTLSLNESDEEHNTLFNRIYNAQTSQMSMLGYGWNFAFNAYLFQEKDETNNLLGMIFVDGDGSRHYFEYDYEQGQYITPKGTFMELTYNHKTSEHTIITRDKTAYIFDDSLRLINIQKPNEDTIIFTYDLDSNLNTIETQNEIVLSFSYYQQTDCDELFYTVDDDHVGLLAQIEDANGNIQLYTYKENEAVLEMVTGGELNCLEQYSYKDKSHTLTKIINSKNSIVKIEYTTDYKVSKIKQEDKFDYEFTYLEDTTTLVIIEGNETKYCSDINGCISSIETSDGHLTTYDYNDNFQIINLSYTKIINDKTITLHSTFRYDEKTGELLNSSEEIEFNH